MSKYYSIKEYTCTKHYGSEKSNDRSWDYFREVFVNADKIYAIYNLGKIDGKDMVTIDMGIQGFKINTTMENVLELMGRRR